MRRFFENPFMLKELRQLTRSRVIAMSLVLYLLAEAAILLLVPAGGIASGTGREAFGSLLVVYLFVSGVLLPLNVFSRTSAERGAPGKVSDLVLSTPLTPAQAIDGKIMAAAALSLMFATALAPFAVAAYTLHGVELVGIFRNVVTAFAYSLLMTCVCVAVASLRVARVVRVGLITLLMIFPLAVGGGLCTDGLFSSLRDFVLMLALMLTVAAILRAAAIGFIAPPGGEHSRALRLTALVASLGWLAEAAWSCSSKAWENFEPLLSWESFMVTLYLFLLAVALCHGYGYSRRQLAERWFWPLATGALNGTAFALVCGTAATLGVVVATGAATHAMEAYGFFCLMASAMLAVRFVWRVLRRWRELPPFLVPLFGVMAVVVLKATASYMANYYSVDRTFWGWLNGDFSANGALGVLEASVSLLAALAINIPAAVATCRLRRGKNGSPKESRTPLPSMKSSCPDR